VQLGGGKASKYQRINPYKLADNQRIATVFAPDDYKTGLVVLRLSPISLWVLLSRLKPDGSVSLSHQESRSIFQVDVRVMQNAYSLLVRYNFIQRRTIGEYWVNPDVAYPMVITSR